MHEEGEGAGHLSRRLGMYVTSGIIMALSGVTTVTTTDTAGEFRALREDIRSLHVSVGVLGEKVRNLETERNGSE